MNPIRKPSHQRIVPTLAAVAATGLNLALIGDDRSRLAFLCVVCIASFLSAYALSAWTLGARTRNGILGRLLVSGVACGGLMAGLMRLMIVLEINIADSIFKPFFVAVFATFGGGLLSLAFLPLFALGFRARRHPSLLTSAHLLRYGGAWFLSCTLAAALLVELRVRSFPPAAIISVVVAVLVGSTALLLGGLQLRGRRRWLEDVRAGRVERYRIVPLTEASAPKTPLYPYEPGPNEECDFALVRVSLDHAHGYRDPAREEEEPLALVRAP